MKWNKKVRKKMAVSLMVIMAYQLIYPNAAMALTSGPSQPEVQSFEPVGTTDMVDMFSGDFVYNIPLLDVEGYPVNISYHGGTTMEQEASWVGLGWNINPGVINRGVRGVPDDFNGQQLSKELHIKNEEILRVGLSLGGEVIGVGDDDPLLQLDVNAGVDVNLSNYKGVSVDLSSGVGLHALGCLSAGVNMGVGSQSGASIDYNAGASMASAVEVGKDQSAGIGMTVGSGYSSRSGMKDISFGLTIDDKEGKHVNDINTSGIGASVPIGMKNYVPVITNSSAMYSISGRLKFGVEAFWCNLYGSVSGSASIMKFKTEGSRSAYGYLYLQNAPSDASAILDFSRDRDGMFNKSMSYLPPATMTYDVYSVSGQGAGGSFRPFRNDIGSVYDAVTTSTSDGSSSQPEGSIGDIFAGGADASQTFTSISSGPWNDIKKRFAFTGTSPGSIYENVYFKQAGELTAVDNGYQPSIGGTAAVDANFSFPAIKPNATTNRDPRGNVMYYHTAKEASIPGVGVCPNIISYPTYPIYPLVYNAYDTTVTVIPRHDTGTTVNRRSDQISAIVNLQKDGSRYVYGIPAMNKLQREVSFSVDPPSSGDMAQGLVSYAAGVNSTSNGKGTDNFYSSTVTPPFAHSYLLTGVLSKDYVDVTGDGPSDDDMGSFTKFNYSRTDSDYRWRAPYVDGKAQYNPGFWSDPNDDKGNYLIGSREQWSLHSIETKNFIAEFYVSQRADGLGSTSSVVNSGIYNIAPFNGTTSSAHSYELDSIKLYNKHDRYINRTNAVPIKTVIFTYDNSLCTGLPNSTGGVGKLTLRNIYTRYGSSDRSLMSPYHFDYEGFNPTYHLENKDRWGNYKLSNTTFTNYEFPYTDQTTDTTQASAWSLTKITLPSGGVISAKYQFDDYAYVQDKRADEMFMVQGMGNTPYHNDKTNELYSVSTNPNLYMFFKRRISSEKGGTIASNYLDGLQCLYFNFNVQLLGSHYEQVKGYATIGSSGVCPDDANYAYVKVASVRPAGGGATLNPVTFTALNTARYNLPQILYPGTDPSQGDLSNILGGLKAAFDDLGSLGKNPIVHLVTGGQGKELNIAKCFIRLASPGCKKIGGGQRVSSLTFNDSWDAQAGGDVSAATYGKNYDYTINDDTYGTISSGVASYEPMIGGDENPLRNPVNYTATAGSTWPPNDPVDLYQETPIGESFYPSASVGYRQVTVTSIHASKGRSSQGIDVYQFYTAKDFPVIFKSTPLNVTDNENKYRLIEQKNLFAATQGYSLIFNDMHGKPKSVEHEVWLPATGTTQKISYEQYKYQTDANGNLDNNVNVFQYDPTSNNIIRTNRLVGVETDVTIDSREKNEETTTEYEDVNMNVSLAFIFTVPIPLMYMYQGDYQNRFRSAVATKITQQYGILQQVISFKEGALTTLTNEVYDPLTGQPVVTSINNEFKDKEYNVNIPAYWGYQKMGGAYNNIGYQSASIDSAKFDHNDGDYGYDLYVPLCNYNIGDVLLMTYNYYDSLHLKKQDTIISYIGKTQEYIPDVSDSYIELFPRYPYAPFEFINGMNGFNSDYNFYRRCVYNVKIKVIESGKKNNLNESIEQYSMLDLPWNGLNQVKTTLNNVVDFKAKVFTNENDFITGEGYTAFPVNNSSPYWSLVNFNRNFLLSDYVYQANRNVNTDPRTAGLYNTVQSLFQYADPSDCNQASLYLAPSANWKNIRTITKRSPNGKELENIDATGFYSTAVYGYNEELPIAVASNAQQGDVLAEGFEDYNLLRSNYIRPKLNFSHTTSDPSDYGYVIPDLLTYDSVLHTTSISPFNLLFGTNTISSQYSICKVSSGDGLQLVQNVAHTGYYSIKTPGTANNNTYSSYEVNIPNPAAWYFLASNDYLPFWFRPTTKYIVSYWLRSVTLTNVATTYSIPNLSTLIVAKHSGTTITYPAQVASNLIDGWQKVECTFTTPAFGGSDSTWLNLPLNYYVDDVRIYPASANMKAFVYNPTNEKLTATLDENNFATFYEYDQEGNLVRTKKETEKGIMTISESRSGNNKH